MQSEIELVTGKPSGISLVPSGGSDKADPASCLEWFGFSGDSHISPVVRAKVDVQYHLSRGPRVPVDVQLIRADGSQSPGALLMVDDSPEDVCIGSLTDTLEGFLTSFLRAANAACVPAPDAN